MPTPLWRPSATVFVEKAADNYDNGTYTDRPTGTYSGDAVTEWVFNAERQEGDLTLIESGDNYYVVLFHSRGRNDYNTVDVRHILISPEASELSSDDEGYEDDVAAKKAEAMDKAEACWRSGRPARPLRTPSRSWPRRTPTTVPPPWAACIPRSTRARWSLNQRLVLRLRPQGRRYRRGGDHLRRPCHVLCGLRHSLLAGSGP